MLLESSKAGNKRSEAGLARKKRQWESWALSEKDCFFEALNEHSKDFDKIQIYLKKRRGDAASAARNKDQVRHFYYRTLNKISKYIPEAQDPSDAKKTNHEVRSLICYGELRKKFRSLKEKDGKKLTELISTGKTTIRYHGRNVSIRAPTCRALKKLNANVAEEHEPIPQKVTIEMIPNDNRTWSIIQGLSHNPRLRTTVSTRKTISSLSTFLRSKWKLRDDVTISLSPCITQSGSRQVGSKTNDYEISSKVKQQASEEKINKVIPPGNKEVTSSLKVTSSFQPAITRDENAGENSGGKVAPRQDSLNASNSGSLTVAELYRKMHNPRKIVLSYNVCDDKSSNQTNHALEQLLKLAATGEFTSSDKKEVSNMSKTKVGSKDTKANKVTKSKSTTKAQKPLAPKPPQEEIVPTVVSPVINQVSTSKSGNHLTYGFTPINTFQRPSTFVPRSKKRQAPRVFVQRTLLPRPQTGAMSSAIVSPSTGASSSGTVGTSGVVSPSSVIGPSGVIGPSCVVSPSCKAHSLVAFTPSPTTLANQNGFINSGNYIPL